MARIKAFVEVPHESRTDWATFKQVAEKLGLRLNQVTGWARSGHVVSCKVQGRRFVSFGDCQAYKVKARLHKKGVKTCSPASKAKEQQPQPGRLIKYAEACKIANRSKQTIRRWVRLGMLKKYEGPLARTGNVRIAMVSYDELAALLAQYEERDTAEATQPEPDPIRCEVVPIQVNGDELAGIRLDGQEVIAAQLLEKILGLQPKSLSTRLGREDWFVEGEDYIVLKGRQMGVVRQRVVDIIPTTSLRTASKLMILTESGVAKVLTSIRSRVTDILATTLLQSNFMRRAARSVMQGDQESFARNMTDDATDALAKLRLFVTTELSEMQGHLAAALEENRDLRQQLDENTYKLDMVDKRLVHMPDDVARSLAPMIAEMARKTHSTGPGFVRDPLLPRPIRPNEDAFYYPRLSSTDVAHKVRRGLPRSQSGSINTQAINACGQKYAGQYWSNRGEEFFGQDWPGYIEKGQSKYGTLRYWYSEAFIPKALKWFRSGQLDLPFTGQQP